jgi:hypothetical protein
MIPTLSFVVFTFGCKFLQRIWGRIRFNQKEIKVLLKGMGLAIYIYFEKHEFNQQIIVFC